MASTSTQKETTGESSDFAKNVRICKHCDSSDFDYENGVHFCLTCGTVDELGSFADVVDQTSFVPNGFNPAASLSSPSKRNTLAVNRKSISKGELCGKNKIKFIGGKFETGQNKVYAAIELFEKIYPSVKSKAVEFKETVAACCMYKVLTDSNLTVHFNDFLKKSLCNPKHFSKAMRLVKEKFGSEIKNCDKNEEICFLLKNGPLTEKELVGVANKTEKLFKLADECSLLTGRSATALIIACSFFSYRQFLIEKRDRFWSKVNFGEFCNRFKIKQKYTANERVKELKKLFVTLAKNPANIFYDEQSSEVTENNIEEHLDHILTCSEIIIKNFLASSQAQSSMGFETFRKKRKTATYSEKNQMTDERARYLNSLPDDELISDSEMDEYIRPPSVVKNYEKTRALILKGKPILDKNSKSILYKDLPSYRLECLHEELASSNISNSEEDEEEENDVTLD